MVLTKADLQQIKATINLDILLKLNASINNNINTKMDELDKTIH